MWGGRLGITMSTNDVGGLSGPATVTFAIHGGRGKRHQHLLGC